MPPMDNDEQVPSGDPDASDGTPGWDAIWSFDDAEEPTEALPTEGSTPGTPLGVPAAMPPSTPTTPLTGGTEAILPPAAAATPPPPGVDSPYLPPVPDSRALIPPTPRPPSAALRPTGDVYRGEDYQDYADFRDGPAARPPRSRLSAPIPEPEQRGTRPSRWSTIGLPLLAGMVGAGLVVGGFFVFRDDAGGDTTAGAVNAAPTVIRETVRTEFIGPDDAIANPTAVARKVIPSVVTVEVGVGDGNGGFNGTGSGSGVVLSEDGYIVTNEHVVSGSDVVTVSFSDGRLYEAELLGADALTDLAVLKIDADVLVPIDIGSTADLQIGDVAIAAGSPLGLEGGPTVSVGVLSAFNREVQTGPAITDRLLGMLQTDAPITRGSSGGALVDGRGALIGVTSAVGVSDVGVEGIGFAIPIEVVQRITGELIANGEVQHSFLGIEGRTSFEDQADGAEAAVGVFIQAIVDDTGASNAGLEEGDVIVSVEGAQVKTINSLVGQLRRYAVGEPLNIEIIRGGEAMTLTIELGPRPDDV